MARITICPKTGLKRGAWTLEEDRLLAAYISRYGHWNWRELPKYAGLLRCGKSCRLRWMNYLRPDIKRGNYSKDEEELIIRMHEKLGNRWSAIAECLPGRTDNEIKNHWHTHIRKRAQQITISNGDRQTAVTRYETPKKREQVQDSVETIAPATLIFESSIVLPLSPENSSGNSMSCADSGAVINKNLLTEYSSISQDSSYLSVAESTSSLNESFLAEDFYVPEYTYDMFSPPPMAESFHPYDMSDVYDMDNFSSEISPSSNDRVLNSWL